jgi:hypothetical protein
VGSRRFRWASFFVSQLLRWVSSAAGNKLTA